MSIKKLNASELQERIRRIVKEEVRAAVLKEELSPYLARVHDKKALSGWLMRQYFNPKKDSAKIWYDPSVTEENVLEHISSTENKGTFPLSTKELSELWRLKKQLGASMGNLSDKDLAGVDEPEEKLHAPEAQKASYKTGDATLRNIGDELGLTPTMINKIETSGMEKFKKLMGGSSSNDTEGQTKNLMQKIGKAREVTANEFVAMLKNSPSIQDFLEILIKSQILTQNELRLIEPEELEALEILKGYEPSRAEMILVQDIEEDDNLFKTFQSAVSKKILPYGRRGRPRKDDSAAVSHDEDEE